MRIVIALGGNALLQRGEPQTVEVQQRNAAAAAASIAGLADTHELVITHGNGPQVGLLALQTGGSDGSPTYPLDVLNAETDGMIGYLLERELHNATGGRKVVTVLTQVEVDPADPAFGKPTKFIGPQYPKPEADLLAAANGWPMAQDGELWRRVVASPAPQAILELSAIRHLVAAGFVTICAGGGGIPVVRRERDRLEGIECVVDKDATSELLAEMVDADCLMMLTDVAAVQTGFGTPQAREIRRATPKFLDQFQFPAGSMGPKVAAACRFAATGRRACIGRLTDIPLILEGFAGTTVSSNADVEA